MSLSKQYIDNMECGEIYEDVMAKILMETIGYSIRGYKSKWFNTKIGENPQGVEIKFDGISRISKKLFIETEERSTTDQPYHPAGIFRNDKNWLYVIGNFETTYLFVTQSLRTWFQNHKPDMKENSEKRGIGFLLPIETAEMFAHIIDTSEYIKTLGLITKIENYK